MCVWFCQGCHWTICVGCACGCEVAAKKKQDEEDAAKKKAQEDEEAARKRAQEDEEAAKKKQDEEDATEGFCNSYIEDRCWLMLTETGSHRISF